ncbi:EI24 domain-containing protein [Pseudolysinimonas sp.]|uniref:EI24 domain-containing protein n=1 Tax=Pseudolysinimonas sp. TaxID=2680009 RepID=UPI00286C6A47|nr:EI24 domain-containing protein [Pseudolysinimonas sp.]
MTAIPPTPAGRRRGPNPITEFFIGASTLLRGFSYWRRRPGAMALGLIPAAIVFAILIALIVLLVTNLDPVTIFLTGFAETWDEGWRNLLRLGFGLALIVGLIVLYAFSFTALTLLIGDWFYQRIWRIVETDLGEFTAGPEPGFWRSTGDALRLAMRAIFTGLLIVLFGLVPVVGTVLAVVIGTFLSGRLVALELTTRPLEARGMTRQQRRAALRSHSPRVLGFGVAVHVCFLIPGGAILVMPAAVAGATVLAKHVLGEVAAAEVSGSGV